MTSSRAAQAKSLAADYNATDNRHDSLPTSRSTYQTFKLGAFWQVCRQRNNKKCDLLFCPVVEGCRDDRLARLSSCRGCRVAEVVELPRLAEGQCLPAALHHDCRTSRNSISI